MSYDDREKHYRHLAEQTLAGLSLSETPSICFHYSARFSRADRDAILEGAKAIRPNGRFTFVWINTHHPVRLFDRTPDTDGSLARGRFVVTAPNQILLSTTGYNQYRKTLGTPQALEINVYEDGARTQIDHRALARQILSLTKLNWASTDSLCGEPITTKYAKDMGYTSAQKYAADDGPVFRDCFALLRRAATRPARDVLKLLDAALFNLIIGNADAHGKNFSLLYERDEITLAPLYDLLSTVSYPDLSPNLAMKIARRARLEDLVARDWARFAEETGLTEPFIRRRAAALADAVIARAPAERAGFAPAVQPAMQQFADLVAARAARLKDAL